MVPVALHPGQVKRRGKGDLHEAEGCLGSAQRVAAQIRTGGELAPDDGVETLRYAATDGPDMVRGGIHGKRAPPVFLGVDGEL